MVLISTYFANASYLGIIGIELKSFGNVVKTSYKNKTAKSIQYYWSSGTVNKLTSNQIDMQVRTDSPEWGTSTYKTVSKNETVNWGGSNVNIFTGTYRLQMKTKKSTPLGAYHSGGWTY